MIRDISLDIREFFSQTKHLCKISSYVYKNKVSMRFCNKFTEDIAAEFFEYFKNYQKFTENLKVLQEGFSEEQQSYIMFLISRMLGSHHSRILGTYNLTETEIQEYKKAIRVLYGAIKKEKEGYSYNGIVLPIHHFELSVFYYELGINYIKKPNKLINTDFIDAGAFIGDSPIILNKLNPQNIYGFEPVKQSFDLMLKTINLNNINNIIPVKSGLGSEIGEMDIAIDGANGISSSIGSNTCQKEKIFVDTIDNFAQNNNLNIGLIKIDTEGMEQDILKGAKNTIKKDKPVLIVSIYHSAKDFFEIKPLIESWNLGYKFRIVKLIPKSYIVDTMLICEVF